MAIREVFLSAVSSEFTEHRTLLKADLSLPGVKVQEQSDLVQGEGKLLQTLDQYIRDYCEAMIHLVGRELGQTVKADEIRWLLDVYSDFPIRFEFLANDLQSSPPILTYTQLESWLVLYHEKRCYLYRTSELDRNPLPTDHPQQVHWQRLKSIGEHRSTFDNPQHLCRCVLRDLNELLPARPLIWGANAIISPFVVIASLFTIIVILTGIWLTMINAFSSKNRILNPYASNTSLSQESVLFGNSLAANDLERLRGAQLHDVVELTAECENPHLNNLAEILRSQPDQLYRFVRTFIAVQQKSERDELELSPTDQRKLSSASDKDIVYVAGKSEQNLIQELSREFENEPIILWTIVQELCK